MKVVINACYGGFSVSKEAAEFMAERGNPGAIEDLQDDYFYGYGITDDQRGYNRSDPDLIAAIEYLGSERASGHCAELKIIEIPDNIEYIISEYDGHEHIAEKHRTWD